MEACEGQAGALGGWRGRRELAQGGDEEGPATHRGIEDPWRAEAREGLGDEAFGEGRRREEAPLLLADGKSREPPLVKGSDGVEIPGAGGSQGLVERFEGVGHQGPADRGIEQGSGEARHAMAGEAGQQEGLQRHQVRGAMEAEGDLGVFRGFQGQEPASLGLEDEGEAKRLYLHPNELPELGLRMVPSNQSAGIGVENSVHWRGGSADGVRPLTV